jgi:hypothetical protein
VDKLKRRKNMKRYSILAAVLVVMAGSAYAADFMDLQRMKVSEVKAAAVEVPAPAAGVAAKVSASLPARNSSPITKVENPKYICQTHGGGHAIALNGNSARVWQVDGAEEGAEEGLELGDVILTRYARSNHLDIEGTLSFYGEVIKLELTMVPDETDPNKPYMIVKINGEDQEPPLERVPCRIVY